MGPKLAGQIEQNSNDDPLKHITQEESSISVTPVDCNYVHKAIQKLKNGKAPGPDKIPIMLIKDVIDLASQPLTMIFNSSLRKGVFPYIWKMAKITPIFKSESRSDTNNNHYKTYEHLKATKALTMSQSAFQ